MLEASNPESVNKTKKNKNNNRPTAVNRFWPDNLAQGQITNSFKGSGGGDDTSPHSDDNEGESPPPPNHSHGHRGAEEGGTTGSGNNNNNHHHLNPNNRTTLGHEGVVMNGTRDNNSMNNCKYETRKHHILCALIELTVSKHARILLFFKLIR